MHPRPGSRIFRAAGAVMNPSEVIALFVALMKREREALEPDAGTRSRLFCTCFNAPRPPAREERPVNSDG